jgi:hypothetical protein
VSKRNPELEAFAKFIVAIEPWLGEVVLLCMVLERKLSPERFAETAQAGLREISGRRLRR